MFKRLLLLLLCAFGLNLSVYAENVRISDLFDSKGRSGAPDALCNLAASELTHINVAALTLQGV